MTAETPDVVSFDGESGRNLALDGEVKRFGVRRLQFVVEAPLDGEVFLRGREGIGRGLPATRRVDVGKGVAVDECGEASLSRPVIRDPQDW